MLALVKTREGKGNISLVEVEEKKPGPGEVKIQVMAAGICGTDIKIYHGDTWSNPPVILGHEFSGIVAEVGDGVTKVKPGDRVVSETAQKICGNCYYCNTGHQLMCSERLSIGYGVDGAFTSFCVVREPIVHRLPGKVSFDAGALCEPSAVAVHAVYDTVGLHPADFVIVMGPGPIGLLTAQAVKGFGCIVMITGTDLDAGRLALAEKLGIDAAVNVTDSDFTEAVNRFSKGRGADVVYDCTGSGQAINAGLGCLKKMGSLVQVGLTRQNLEINYGLLTQRELRIFGTFGHNWKAWDTALRLIEAGSLKVEELITHRFALQDWEEAFGIAGNQQGIKILLHPQGRD